MFFSAKELQEHINTHPERRYEIAELLNTRWAEVGESTTLSLNKAKQVIKKMRKAIVARNLSIGSEGSEYVRKWLRPWDVVPKLKNFRPPVGDYGIGVEVEYGFTSQQNASYIANAIKDWKYIAVDYEGGTNPIEATFPPVLASKVDNCQAIRYLRLLKKNEDKLVHHAGGSCVGTHINVSVGGVTNFSYTRVEDMSTALRWLDGRECFKYFGRSRPYGYVYDQGKYLEYKLFNSTTSTKMFKRYVAVAIALTDMITGNDVIDRDTVLETLRSKVKL